MWSPNGARFAYFTDAHPEALHVYDTQSRKDIGLSSIGGIATGGWWFPDGRRLAVTYGAHDAKTRAFLFADRLRVFDVEARRVTDLVTQPCRGPVSLAFHPGGDRLALGDVSGLWIMDLLPGGGRPRHMVSSHDAYIATKLSISPDGRFIAYLAIESGRFVPGPARATTYVMLASLRVYDAETGEVRALQGPTAGMSGAWWHPQSRRLAYVVHDRDAGRSRIYVGSYRDHAWKVSKVLDVAGTVSLGGWSEDGEQFAYALAERSQSRIHVVTGEAWDHDQVVSPEGAADRYPTWRPRTVLEAPPARTHQSVAAPKE